MDKSASRGRHTKTMLSVRCNHKNDFPTETSFFCFSFWLGCATRRFGGQTRDKQASCLSVYYPFVQVSDLVIILNQRRAIEAFTKGGNLTFGGNFTVAVGPLGRWALGEPHYRGHHCLILAQLNLQDVVFGRKRNTSFFTTLSCRSRWTGFFFLLWNPVRWHFKRACGQVAVSGAIQCFSTRIPAVSTVLRQWKHSPEGKQSTSLPRHLTWPQCDLVSEIHFNVKQLKTGIMYKWEAIRRKVSRSKNLPFWRATG